MDRRTFSRVCWNLAATLDYAGESYPAEIVNLNLNGLLVKTAASPVQGDEVAVTFSIDRTEEPMTVRCFGRVVRADGEQLGIAFEEMDLHVFEQLRNVLFW